MEEQEVEAVENENALEEHVYSNWRSLIKPKRVERDLKSNKTFGKFTIRPLERGFGTTIGNSLRRILLSSLQGAAVTRQRWLRDHFGSQGSRIGFRWTALLTLGGRAR